MSYQSYTVDIPQVTGKITYRKVKNTKYVYYEYDRTYDPVTQYTTPKRKTIGKVSDSDPSKMYPNELFRIYFPDVETPDDFRASRSGALHVGTYIVIDKIINDYGLRDILEECLDDEDVGLFLDLASYTIVEENNAGQYYPYYAYDHPLFTDCMKQLSDSTVSSFLHRLTEDQSLQFLEAWNSSRDHRERIYITYDSTNKECHAGDVDMIEIGHTKDGAMAPIFNYAVAYDNSNREPLLYEKYAGSIVDVSQLQYVIEKINGYGYKDIGVILDRGYFSASNIRFMDKHGINFVMMLKGNKKLVDKLILKNKGTFENKRSCNIYEYGVYGITVKSKLYETDKTERYFHIFHSIDKESAERSEIEYKLNKLGLYLEAHKNKHLSPSKQLLDYFWLEYYDERTGKAITSFDEKSMEHARFLTATEKASVIENEIDLAGYFCIITSEKMTAKEAITLYKNRDASEKLFRGDKSYMGNKSMRAHHNESVDSKIFIEFIALIIRNKIYTSLKDEMVHIRKKPNYMMVPAAIKELEKIEMIRHPDGTYGLYSGATSTQKSILKAFGIDTNYLKHLVTKLSVVLRETEGGNQ